MSIQEHPLPCPFCGELPGIQSWHGGAKTKRMVNCYNEECYVQPQVTGPTRARAVRNWNQRRTLRAVTGSHT